MKQKYSRFKNRTAFSFFVLPWHLAVLFCVVCSITCIAQKSPYMITFFIRPLPTYPTRSEEKAIVRQKKLSAPGSILKTIIEKELNPTLLHSGIYVSYAGMVTRSNKDGQVIFDRKTADVKLNVLVTEDIKAVPVDPVKGATIYGFVINPKAQAQHYQYELLKDPETELYFWNVDQISVPKDKRIPYDTIIIFANPKHIIIPFGSTVTAASENLVLPDIYATPNLHSAANAFLFLKIRHYFAPVTFDYKFYPEEYQQKIR